jgi:hypothetical protein
MPRRRGRGTILVTMQAIGVPPLSPKEGTAARIHQHLDLYVGFGTAARPPSPVPSGYRFPPGL